MDSDAYADKYHKLLSALRWTRRFESVELITVVRGRLHVSESAQESPFDSAYELNANRIGSTLFFYYPLHWFVNTFQPIKAKNSLAGHPWQQIVHRIVRKFVCKIALVDSP
jgi:hypothetical protein